MMTFSQMLKKLRNEKGYTQEQIAEMSNVSRQAVAKWEAGSTFPDTEKIIRLAKIFDVSIDELLTGDKPNLHSKISTLSKTIYLDNERIVNQALKTSMVQRSPDDSINSFISYIGKQIGCDRIYIFETNGDSYFQNSYEWCGKGISSQKEYLQHIPIGDMNAWLNVFSSGKYIFIEDIESLAGDDPIVYRWLKPKGIETVLAFPLFGGRAFLGVDNPATAFLKQTSSLIEIMVHFLEIMINQRDLYQELNISILQNKQISELSKGVQYRFNLASGELYVDRVRLKKSGYQCSFKNLTELKKFAMRHPEFRDFLIRDGIRYAIEEKKNVWIEFLSFTEEHKVRWNRLTICPFLDANGNVLQLYGVLQDRSSRHQIIERYNSYVSAFSGGLYICNLSNPVHLQYTSDSLCEFLGYTRDEFEQKIYGEYSNIIEEEDKPIYQDYVNKLARRPGIESCEYRIRTKDGTIVTVIDTMESIESRTGVMYGYAFILEKSKLQALLDMANEREKKQIEVINKQYDVLTALGKGYHDVFCVWLKGDKAQIVHLGGSITSRVINENTDFIPYYHFCKKYVQNSVHPDDQEKMLKAMHPNTVRAAFFRNDEYSVIYRVIDNDEVSYFQMKYIRVGDRNYENEIRFVAAFKNVDKMIKKERLQEEQLKNRMDIINAILRTFTCGYYLDYKNDTFSELACVEKRISKIVGKQGCLSKTIEVWKGAFGDKDAAERICEFLNIETLEERLAGQKHLSIRLPIDDAGWFEANILVVDYDDTGNMAHCVFAVSDITKEKEREREWLRSLGTSNRRSRSVMKASYIDELTGVMNRSAYERDYQTIDEYNRVGILYCDVNSLKEINSRYGYKRGDMKLVEFASLIKKYFSIDCIYRIGGDEFICMIEGISRKSFINRANTFVKAVKKNENIASVGFAYGQTDQIDSLIRQAESEMYVMKDVCKRKD